MPYLLSLLAPDATIAGSKHYLCCYSNDTVHLQLLRAVKADECLFKRVVFPGERVLFAALSETTLEICAPLTESAPVRRVYCERLSLYMGKQAALQSVPTPVPVSASVV